MSDVNAECYELACRVVDLRAEVDRLTRERDAVIVRMREAAAAACEKRAEAWAEAQQAAYYVSSADDAAARCDESLACADAIRSLDLAAVVRGAP